MTFENVDEAMQALNTEIAESGKDAADRDSDLGAQHKNYTFTGPNKDMASDKPAEPSQDGTDVPGSDDTAGADEGGNTEEAGE